jgi:hypothetical protein
VVQSKDAAAAMAMQRVHRRTPEALLEQPNIPKTAADSKGHTDVFI